MEKFSAERASVGDRVVWDKVEGEVVSINDKFEFSAVIRLDSGGITTINNKGFSPIGIYQLYFAPKRLYVNVYKDNLTGGACYDSSEKAKYKASLDTGDYLYTAELVRVGDSDE